MSFLFKNGERFYLLDVEEAKAVAKRGGLGLELGLTDEREIRGNEVTAAVTNHKPIDVGSFNTPGVWGILSLMLEMST